jgi:antitoxin component of RelBE/YafQ-DinJ toxin-antitoxin module
MNTASLSITVETETKAKVQQIAKKNGLSISEIMNRLLQLLIKDTSLLNKTSEKPSEYLLKSIKVALQQKKEGRVSPKFSNSNDALKWLNR